MVSIGQMKLETQQQLYDPKSRHQDEEQVEGQGGFCQGPGGLGGAKEAALQVIFRVTTTGVNHHVVPITLLHYVPPKKVCSLLLLFFSLAVMYTHPPIFLRVLDGLAFHSVTVASAFAKSFAMSSSHPLSPQTGCLRTQRCYHRCR